VMLREGDTKGFLMMVAPTGGDALDEWVVKSGKAALNETTTDQQYHFLLEEEGYMLNRGSMAFLNVLPEAEYSIRGHTGGWDRTKAAGREYGATMHFNFVNSSLVEDALDKELEEVKESEEEDKLYIAQIAAFPRSDEKRVISFGLYGAKEKYTAGAGIFVYIYMHICMRFIHLFIYYLYTYILYVYTCTCVYMYVYIYLYIYTYIYTYY
jgi:hypothetical protein